MKYKTLGNTGLLVSQLCLGTMTFSSGRGIYQHIGQMGQSEADRLVQMSLKAGINFIDTADIYSFGESEEMLGRALRNLDVARTDIVLATKVGNRSGHGRNRVGASRSHIMNSVEDIDLYQIHANDVLTPLEETLRALDDLVSQGKVRYIGISNWQAWKIARALGVSDRLQFARFDTLQAYYSLVGRDLERELGPMIEAEKMGLLVWSPLAGGLLSGKVSREQPTTEGSRRSGFDFPIVDKERAWRIIDEMKPIAAAHDCSPARVALAWLLARPVVTSVIIGAKRSDQLADNLAAIDLKLSVDELDRLDRVSVLPPEYPGWMLETLGADRLGPVDLWQGATTQA